jgi:hypothetical protein
MLSFHLSQSMFLKLLYNTAEHDMRNGTVTDWCAGRDEKYQYI